MQYHLKSLYSGISLLSGGCFDYNCFSYARKLEPSFIKGINIVKRFDICNKKKFVHYKNSNIEEQRQQRSNSVPTCANIH